MLTTIRNMLKEKGQGIVEYALILAFVVGIAMMLNGANLGGAVKDTFDKVAAILNGGDNTYLGNHSVANITIKVNVLRQIKLH